MSRSIFLDILSPSRNAKTVKTLIAPRDLYIVLTSRCNLLCNHCYGHFGEKHLNKNELSGEEWLRVLREASDLGVFFVNIAGGEPTLHPDFVDIIDGMIEMDLHFVLTTNGMGTRPCREAIVRARRQLLGLKISLDGPTSESHGSLRVGHNRKPNPQAFNQTMNTLEYLRDHKVPFTIATCIHQGNIDLIPEFEELLLDLRPNSWFLATISPTGRAKDYYKQIYASDERWSSQFWKSLKIRLEKSGIYVRYIDMAVAMGAEKRPSPFSCPAATSFCEINSDGTMAPCPLSRVEIPDDILRFGNVRDQTIASIWSGPVFSKFREWRGFGCDGCSIFGECGRCVAQSIQWWHDPKKPPPFCVGKGEILGLANHETLKRELEKNRMTQLRV